jgi:MFS superfamily sulfate permease-like transporter
MSSKLESGVLKNLRYDLPAGLVVFLVALPLCLGIALASNAPLFSGVVSGIIAGIVVGLLSGSPLSVSGPAAGLTVIVASSINQLGSFELFLCAVFLSGILQMLLSVAKAGHLGGLVPNSVVKGLLVAIGLTIILKQIPHLVGGRGDFGDESGSWHLAGQDNVFGEIIRSILTLNPAALSIGIASVALLVFWESPTARKWKIAAWVPGPLLTVIFGIAANEVFQLHFPSLALSASDGHLVELPHLSSFSDLVSVLNFPSFSGLFSLPVWTVAVTIAAIGSLETLLCLEATEKMDPFHRRTSNDRELFAQGVGNLLAGLLGGIPMTSVIVRSSANVFAGGRTRMAAIYHGVLLLLSALLIPNVLNLIPLASLAAVLIIVGFKLAHPKVFKHYFQLGASQNIPFLVTIVAIMATNLLTGVVIGIIVGGIVTLKSSYYSALTVVQEDDHTLIRFAKDVTFVHKTALKDILAKIPDGSRVYIDGTHALFIDQDIYDIVADFERIGLERGIHLEKHNLDNKRFHFFSRSGT